MRPQAELSTLLASGRRLFADGGMGTMLQAAGLPAGYAPERWNEENPAAVRAVHDAYAAAGAGLLTANTFGANALRLRRAKRPPAALAAAGIRLAREAADAAPQPCYAALDIGPLGAFLAPLGTLSFEDAVSIFAEPIRAGAADADCILIETMGDVQEAKAAVTAALANSGLPVFVTMSFDAKGRLMSGETIEQAADALSALGIAGFGCNCGLGPRETALHCGRLAACTALPLIFSPNAGLPRYVDGNTVYDVDPEEFVKEMQPLLDSRAAILGGCCGTTPAHIAALIETGRAKN